MSLRERTRRVGIVGPLIVALEPGTPVPAIHLDLYLIRNSKPLKWRARGHRGHGGQARHGSVRTA